MRPLHLFQEPTGILSVAGYGRDGRFVYLFLRLILSLTLIHTSKIVFEIAVGEGHNLFLGHIGLTFEASHNVFPPLVVDEGIDKQVRALVIFLQRAIKIHLDVIDNRRKQVIGKIAALQFVHFLQQQGAHFFQRLPFFGQSHQQEQSIVVQSLIEGSGIQHPHRL